MPVRRFNIKCVPSIYTSLKRIETQNCNEDLILALTDAERVKKPKLPNKRLLRRAGKKRLR